MVNANADDSQRAQVIYAQIIARAWQEPEYRLELLTNSNSVIEESGLEIPEGVTVQVLQNTDTIKHVVLPYDLPVENYLEIMGDILRNILPLPKGIELRVHQNTADINYLVLPNIPSSGQPEREIAARMAVAYSQSTVTTAFNVAAAANAAAVTNAAVVSNAVGATNVAGAVSAVVVLGIVIGSVV